MFDCLMKNFKKKYIYIIKIKNFSQKTICAKVMNKIQKYRKTKIASDIMHKIFTIL